MKITVLTLACIMLVMPMAALAGDLDATKPPTDAGSAMFTIEDIYNRLNDGTVGAKRSGPFEEPGSGPASTGHTLDDVMNKAPEKDDANGATAADVGTGKTFWGLTSGEWGLQTGTASGGGSCGVPETGQSTQYDTNTTKADDGGTDPPGDSLPTNDRFSDNGDGTVTDNLTGLIWLQNAYCANKGMNWQTALDAVLELNTNGTMDGNDCGDTGNHTDWRLPTLREMQSLIHYGYSKPALSNDAGTDKWTSGADSTFSNVQSNTYWTSTTYAYSTTSAWDVGLDDGAVDYGYKKFTPYYVWPVRAGQ